MATVQEITRSLHENVLDAARRAGVEVDQTNFAAALTDEASIGVAALALSAEEQGDLRGGRNLMFVTLTLPPGIDKTVDGVPIADGAYLLNISLDDRAERASARLMTTAGREVGVLPAQVTPSHVHKDRFAVSGAIDKCGCAGDLSFEAFGYQITITVSIRWC